MVSTTVDPVAEANRKARAATAERTEDEKLAKAELRKRKAADIQNIPLIPMCPGLNSIGGVLQVDINSKDGISKAVAAWEWWHKVNQEYPDRLVTYISRMFPIQIERPRGERSEETVYGFPDVEFAPEFANLESWLLQRFGSGNYQFWINDSAMNNACMVKWRLNGIWRLEEFPPILDPAKVDLAHGSNAQYIAFLQRKNILKDYEDKPVAEQQPSAAVVAQAAASAAQQASTAGMAGVATALANTVKDLATRPAPPQVDTASIVKDTLAVVLDGVRQQQSVSAAAVDPAAHVRQVIDLAKIMQPAPAPAVDIAGVMKEARESAAAAARIHEDLNKELRERDREERNALRAELRELKQRPPEDPLASLEKTFTLVERIKGIGASGDEEESKGGKEPWWADMAKAILPALAPVIGLGAQYIATKLAPTQPPPPQPQQPQPGLITAHNPAPPTQEPQVNAQEMMLWNAIGAQLQNHFATGKSGHEFAEWFIGERMLGRDNYLSIASQFTRDQVIASMKRYAPSVAATVLMADGTPHGQFLKFMDEFMDHQTVLNEGEPEPEAPTVIEAETVTPLRRVRQAR